MIKAIETMYNGYRFRSRLEARWAVFFDTLNIPYEYEKEGFDLDGTWYLPDFWLPEQECWIEIKGEHPTEEELEKAFILAELTGKIIYIFFGEIPLPDTKYGGLSPDNWSAYKCFIEGGSDMPYWWCECPDCGYLGIEWSGLSDRLDCKQCQICYLIEHRKVCNYCHQCTGEPRYETCPTHDNTFHKGCPRHSAKMSKWPNYDTPRLVKAYTAARQARFEHGERP